MQKPWNWAKCSRNTGYPASCLLFSSSSASLGGLTDALHLEGTFEAKQGVVNGTDMVKTARLLSREHLIGGRTHFD